MKRDDQDRLLSELLAGSSAEELRRRSLQGGLAAIRQRRRRRRAAAVLLSGAIAVAFAVMLKWNPRPVGEAHAPSTAEMANASDGDHADEPAIRYIDDEELAELLADRSYALIGPPGRQRLVFTDEPVGSDADPSSAGSAL